MPSHLRRISRVALSAASLLGGAALLWRSAPRSPILTGVAIVGVILVLLWLRRRDRRQLGGAVSGFSGQDLVVSVMLVGGLWIGLYAVFSLGDVGSKAGPATSIPLGYDATSLAIGDVLSISVLATIGFALVLVPFRRAPQRRRNVRETSLVGRKSVAREVMLTPRTTAAVDGELGPDGRR